MFNKTSNPFAKPQSPPNNAPASTNRSAGVPVLTQADAPPARPITPTGAQEIRPKVTGTSGETGSRLIVGPDVKLKSAEILDCDTLVVEGRVEATMDSRVIRIAEHGLYTGKVSIDIAEIHGHFEGELTARSQLLIHATGKVSGKVRYGKMLIEEGGQISGEIRALDDDEAVPSRPLPEAIVVAKIAAG